MAHTQHKISLKPESRHWVWIKGGNSPVPANPNLAPTSPLYHSSLSWHTLPIRQFTERTKLNYRTSMLAGFLPRGNFECISLLRE